MLALPVLDRITSFDELVNRDSAPLPPGAFMDVRIRRLEDSRNKPPFAPAKPSRPPLDTR